MAPLPDAEARRRGLTDFQTNLVVTAGAGTGKTSLLVGRLLTAFVRLHMEPNQVLALTFTENAATEMRERLTRLLASVGPFVRGEALEDESDRFTLEPIRPGPEDVRRAEDVLESIDRLQISTFHGYCLRFLKQHARRLDLPPDVDLSELSAGFQDFSGAFLDYLREQPEDDVHPALERFDPAELRKLAWEAMTVPEDALQRCAERPEPADLEAHADAARQIITTYPRALPRFQACVRSIVAAYDWLLGSRDAPPDDLPDKPNRPGARVAEPERTRVVDEVAAHLERVRPLVLADDDGIACAMDFVRPFLTRYRRQRTERGELTFDDLLILVRQHLMANAELRTNAGRDLKAILVDEFQDTDPLQYDIVFLLAAQPVEGRVTDPMSLPLRDNVLFIVGDAKQSIYRFRRADIAAFSRATDAIASQGGSRVDLVSNFRCAQPVLEFVNRVCTTTLAADPPYQFGYEPVVPTREATRDVTVEILVPRGSEGLSSTARRSLEGQLVVQQLDALRRSGMAFGEMAILLRAAADTSWLLRPLRHAGIPYTLEGSRRFYARYEVVLATALVSAMARPHDPVPVLGVLRSGWSRATDRDIHKYLVKYGSLDFRLPIRGRGPVQETLHRLAELHSAVWSEPLDQAVVRLLADDTWTITEGTGFEGAQRLANVERMLDRLLSRGGHSDLHEVSDFLERSTRQETEDEESPLFDRDFDAVRILTVHASKGLEFGAVIVPDLARPVRPWESFEDAQIMRQYDADGRELVSVRIGDCRNTASFHAEAAMRSHRLAEERRLFYVAATRAKHYLGVVCAAKVPRDSLWQKDVVDAITEFDPADSTAHVALVSVERRSPAAPTDAATVLDAWRAHEAMLESTVSDESEPAPSPSALPLFAARNARDEAESRVPAFGQTERHAAVRLGTLAHRYFALVDPQRTAVDDELVTGLCRSDTTLAPDLRMLASTFHESELCRRIRSATTVRREVPVAFVDAQGRTVSGVIDLLMNESESSWTIVDHKTDRVLDGDHTRAADAYRAQLSNYGNGVCRALGLDRPPQLEVWFARDDSSVVL